MILQIDSEGWIEVFSGSRFQTETFWNRLQTGSRIIYLDPILFALVQRIRGINGLVCEVFFVHASAWEPKIRHSPIRSS
jgi:hypothetical protein